MTKFNDKYNQILESMTRWSEGEGEEWKKEPETVASQDLDVNYNNEPHNIIMTPQQLRVIKAALEKDDNDEHDEFGSSAREALIGMIDNVLSEPYSRKMTHGFAL